MFNPFPTKPALHISHPDRASEEILGSADGKFIFESMIAALQNKTAAKAA